MGKSGTNLYERLEPAHILPALEVHRSHVYGRERKQHRQDRYQNDSQDPSGATRRQAGRQLEEDAVPSFHCRHSAGTV